MKCYLILRENVESGPFTLEEMKEQNLLPTDLIWVEGSSNSWKFPYEINGLAPSVQSPAQKEFETFSESEEIPEPKRVYVALPPQPSQPSKQTINVEAKEEAPQPDVLPVAQPLETLRANLEAHRKSRRFRFATASKSSSGMGWIAAVFVGVLISAVMIKKMVDAMDERAASLSAAALPVTALTQPAQPEEDKTYRNALSTEIVPADTVAVEKPKKAPKKVNIKKQVNLTASNYKKGMFGGIHRLKLQVENKSEHVLDKVTIEVQYLKPNGDVIAKEKHHVMAVAPKSTKTLEVPPSKRGVDFKCSIVNIQSHAAKAPMRDL